MAGSRICGHPDPQLRTPWAGVTAPSDAAVTQRIANGGFESADAQWTLHGAVICTEARCGRSPRGGTRFFSSSTSPENGPAGIDNYQLGSTEQTVYVPELPATLRFDIRATGGAVGTTAYLQAFYRGDFLGQPDVSDSWQTVTLALPDAAADTATAGLLQLYTFCDNQTVATAACPVVDLDNVKVLTGTDTDTDTKAPQTRITKGPSGSTTSRKATFGFSSSEEGSTFKCKVDDSAWKACTSPATQRVSVGSHTFRVRATDASGNTDPTPAKLAWQVLR